jgi:hypothetical protein
LIVLSLKAGHPALFALINMFHSWNHPRQDKLLECSSRMVFDISGICGENYGSMSY